MRNFSDLNGLCNYQDVTILCKVLKNRFEFKTDGFNPRHCNLAGGLSRCIEREKSKVIIGIPTNAKQFN